ncbi:MAG: hypothetical protein ACK58N_09225 [Synechocystis sp.]|jgi:hypothetical protein
MERALADKRKKRRSPSSFGKPLLGLVGLTLLLYLLRGWQIVTVLPGGIFLGLWGLTLLFVLLYGLEITRH